jgi:hypothetical protein
MQCDRCGGECIAYRTSWFNTQTICIGPDSCDTREMAHPRIGEARAAEAAAVKQGDYNFPGIGLPADLR